MQTFREMKCEMKVKRELEEGFLCTKERERLKLFIKENVPEGKSECVA